MKHQALLPLAIIFLLSSCNLWNTEAFPDADRSVGAFRPIYLSEAEAHNVEVLAPQAIAESGKIYVFGSYLFVNDRYEGIHVINNQDPRNPQKLAFIRVKGNIDMAVKNNTLYADNIRDLLVFDIQNPQNIQLVKRVEDALPAADFPPAENVYFECVDPSKGLVVGWEFDENYRNAECWR